MELDKATVDFFKEFAANCKKYSIGIYDFNDIRVEIVDMEVLKEDKSFTTMQIWPGANRIRVRISFIKKASETFILYCLFWCIYRRDEAIDSSRVNADAKAFVMLHKQVPDINLQSFYKEFVKWTKGFKTGKRYENIKVFIEQYEKSN